MQAKGQLWDYLDLVKIRQNRDEQTDTGVFDIKALHLSLPVLALGSA